MILKHAKYWGRYYGNKLYFTDEMLSKEDITVMQTFLHCIFEITLYIFFYRIEIDYVNDNDVKSNIYR